MSYEKKPSILIVDDERKLMEALVFKFEAEGFEVWSAYDGEEGLHDALKHQPDIILLDVVMPKMDGITMLEKLRENMWGKTAKVIILSNLSDWSDAQKAIEHHVHDVLIKSDWKIDDVVKKVKEKLAMV